MSEEYKTKMARAESCERLIARLWHMDDPNGEPYRLNFAGKVQRDWQEVGGNTRAFGRGIIRLDLLVFSKQQ